MNHGDGGGRHCREGDDDDRHGGVAPSRCPPPHDGWLRARRLRASITACRVYERAGQRGGRWRGDQPHPLSFVGDQPQIRRTTTTIEPRIIPAVPAIPTGPVSGMTGPNWPGGAPARGQADRDRKDCPGDLDRPSVQEGHQEDQRRVRIPLVHRGHQAERHERRGREAVELSAVACLRNGDEDEDLAGVPLRQTQRRGA